MNIGERLKALRKARGLSKNRLAQLAGISQTHISDIEAGKKNPTVETLRRICDALGISLIEFLDDTKEPGLHPDAARLAKIAEKLPPEERRALLSYIEARLKSDEKN